MDMAADTNIAAITEDLTTGIAAVDTSAAADMNIAAITAGVTTIMIGMNTEADDETW
jgi:hypothetical protein